MAKTWVLTLTSANRNTDRTDETFLCENKDVALALFAKLRSKAVALLNRWSDNNFVTEYDEEAHFLGQDNDFDCWIEISVSEQRHCTMDDVILMDYLGKAWSRVDEDKLINLEDGIWWLVVTIEGDKVYCNNYSGKLLLVREDGKRYDCYI